MPWAWWRDDCLPQRQHNIFLYIYFNHWNNPTAANKPSHRMHQTFFTFCVLQVHFPCLFQYLISSLFIYSISSPLPSYFSHHYDINEKKHLSRLLAFRCPHTLYYTGSLTSWVKATYQLFDLQPYIKITKNNYIPE